MTDIQGFDVGVGGAVAVVVLAALQVAVIILYQGHIRTLRAIVDKEREATRIALKHIQWAAMDCDIHRREAAEARTELSYVKSLHDWIMDTHPIVYEEWVGIRVSETVASERKAEGSDQR